MRRQRSRRPILIAGIVAIVLAFLLLRSCVGNPVDPATAGVFTVSKSATTADVKDRLAKAEFLQDHWFFGVAMLLHGGYWRIQPGGYRVTKDLDSWALAGILTSTPSLKWFTVPEGLRREQIAERLTEFYTWDQNESDRFLMADVEHPYGLLDGFYFPDTYLLPLDATPEEVAKKFVVRFNEVFDPLLPELRAQNIKFDTAVKLASIIQREAGGKHDMALIAGVLWNRLLIKMRLEVDATLQYMRGNDGDGYWAPIDIAIKKVDSPYNTYMYAGLPPHPISNPGLDAINAVINPEETKCLFYLHDNDAQIHCSETYEEHLRYIETYLKN